jgi:hypothetical protein
VLGMSRSSSVSKDSLTLGSILSGLVVGTKLGTVPHLCLIQVANGVGRHFKRVNRTAAALCFARSGQSGTATLFFEANRDTPDCWATHRSIQHLCRKSQSYQEH